MHPALTDAISKGPIEFRYPISIICVHWSAAIFGALLLLAGWYGALTGSMQLEPGLRIAEFFALGIGTIGWFWYYELFLPRTRQVFVLSAQEITLTGGPGSPMTLKWSEIGTVRHRIFAYTLDLVSRDGARTIRVGGDVAGFKALKDIALTLSKQVT